MKLIVVGCGETGKKILSDWADRRYQIYVVDQKAVALEEASAIRPLKIQQGDASDIRVLIKASLEKGDIFLALTGDDHINLFSSFMAREIFEVEKIICRVQNSSYAEIFAGRHIHFITPADVVMQKIPLGGFKHGADYYSWD